MACSLLLVVQLHDRHPTTHRKTVLIPGSTTLLRTQIAHFRDPHPTPRGKRDCIPQYQSPLHLQLNMSSTDAREVPCRTPQRVTCRSQVHWTKFGKEGFRDLKDSLNFAGFVVCTETILMQEFLNNIHIWPCCLFTCTSVRTKKGGFFLERTVSYPRRDQTPFLYLI